MKLVRRIFLVLAVGAAVLAGIAAIFYGVEDWRGAHAWAACKQELEARGEHLDAAAFIPPAVPDDQNLAMAPLFVRMYGYRVDPVTGLLTFPNPATRNALKDEIDGMPGDPGSHGTGAPRLINEWDAGHELNLAAWQQYYLRHPEFPHRDRQQTPAEDVLLVLTKYDRILDDLAEAAASRPRTRFPVNWTEPDPAVIALPHYNALHFMTGVLKLRATANLTLGHDESAIRDLALGQRLIGISAADPFVIAQLISATGSGWMLQPIWEGLKARRWSYAELEQIKTGLLGLDYLAGYKISLRFERAMMMCKMANYLKAHGGLARIIQLMQGAQGETRNEDRTLNFIYTLIDLAPGGWYDENKAIGSRLYQNDHIDVIDAKAHRVWLAKVQAATGKVQTMPYTPYNWFVKITLPVFNSVLTRMAASQADIDHAVIACALEQFYLDHHTYPTQLDELIPSYLGHVPPDVIDGKLTRYRTTPEGRYVLYSIGWNGRDDGGQIAWQKGFTRRDNTQGDWAWQYNPL